MLKNKRLIAELILLFVLIGALGYIYMPKYIAQKQKGIMTKIKSNNNVFVQKVLAEFEHDAAQKPKDVAQKVADTLNQTEVNPFNKKNMAYSFDPECKGCSLVEYDNELSMVILTTYDTEGALKARTVIKPPSYVVYFKE